MTPSNRIPVVIKRTVAILMTFLRRAFGNAMNLVLHDQLADLSRQTERLGSASVESITYVGGELNRLDERLKRIEAELASLREAVDSRESPPEGRREPAGDVASGRHSG